MDDLTRCLYDFICTNRMGSVYADPEYMEVSHMVALQSEKVQNIVDKTARKELNRLLDSMAALSCIESEHLFQATLKLARELGRTAAS